MTALPSELVSLVHHVHLNRSGWWHDAMERLVLATVWLAESPIRVESIPDAIRNQFQVGVDLRFVQNIVGGLRSRGKLMVLPNGNLKLTEERRQAFERERRRGAFIEERARRRFVELVESSGTGLDGVALWSPFTDRWLYPTVCNEGARLYEFVNGSPVADWTSMYDLARFMEGVPPEHRPAMLDVVVRFLSPQHAEARTYLLRLMDAYFVVEASRLDAATIEALAKLSGQRPTFTVLLDTNILFSVLGLHGRSAQEATDLLISLADKVSDRVQVRLYALPITIDETRTALQREMNILSGLRLSPKAAMGAVASGSLSEVALAYAEAVGSAGRSLSAAEFLAPYIQNLRTILGQKGIELYNANLERLSKREDVLADVDQQLLSARGGAGKSRGQVLHDTILWHFVQEKRPPVVESPTDALFWVVTEDHRLIAFDQLKQMHAPAGVPICLKPLGLIQMLQLWVGRTVGMEQAILGGVRLSFLAPSFDAGAEQATVKILQVLSRFENVEDLPQKTITRILLNEALKHKLTASSDDEDEQIALVREALIEEQRRIVAEGSALLRAEEERRRNAEKDLSTLAATVEDRELELKNYKTKFEQISDELSELRTRAQESDAREAAYQQERERRSARRTFGLKWLLAPAIVFGALAAAYLRLANGAWSDWRIGSGGACASLAGWLWAMTRWGGRIPEIDDWKLFQVIRQVRNMLLTALGAVVLAIVGNAAYDIWAKPLVASKQPQTNDAGDRTPSTNAPAPDATQRPR
jgi:hypothetical protein